MSIRLSRWAWPLALGASCLACGRDKAPDPPPPEREPPGGTVTVDFPIITNLRLDPFERTTFDKAPPAMMEFWGHEFWRAVFVQDEVARLGQSFVEFPPMQKGAAFNIEAVKEQIVQAIRKKGTGD